MLTIPDRGYEAEYHTEVKHKNTQSEQPLSQRIQQLDKEIISFHFQEDGIYHKRQNKVEAEYIAQMVRGLLQHDPTQSIGIVAFSMQQQDNIEQALTTLASQDSDFDKCLNAAYELEEDEQYLGLFVKNLENVQGDERDIIIISVCYGYNEKGKMLMNFGPINRKGGEKRLNVIFSRAKKHMAIVSSIKYHDIKNEYNEGANYLRRFLQYAELVSSKQADSAQDVLTSIRNSHNDNSNKDGTTHNKDKSESHNQDVVIEQLCAYIHGLGYQTKVNVGLSDFKVAIAVKPTSVKANVNQQDKQNQPEPDKYILGILLDAKASYTQADILDQYVLRPNLLRVFGWNVLNIYKKDWLEKPELVKEQLQKQLMG